MSTRTNSLASATRTTWVWPVGVAAVCAIVAFMASPNAPLGGFWRPTPDVPAPSGAQLPLFILLNVAEVLTFGIGVSFLIFGYRMVRAISPASTALTRLAHLSIAWSLINWWPHDSLHIHFGLELNSLLGIEYGFHLTLMIAGVLMAWFFLTLLRQRDAR